MKKTLPVSKDMGRVEHTPTPVADRWYMTAAQLADGERYCTCCERDLSGHAVRMLELDQRTDTYHDFMDVPEDRSQGWFPFGLTCAKKLVAKEAKRRATLSRIKTEG